MAGMAGMAVENVEESHQQWGGFRWGIMWVAVVQWCTILQLQTKARKLLFFFSAILLLLAIYAKVKC